MGSSSERSHRGEPAHAGGGGHGPPFVVAGALLALLAAALVWLMGGGMAGGHASTQDPVTMYEDPRAADLLVGGNDLIIAEKVAGIPEGTGLGAFSFAFFFNNQLVDVSVSEGPFLSSTGRTTMCLPSSSENLVRFSCVSNGTQPGPAGSGVLAYVVVRPKPGLSLRPTLGNGVIAALDSLSQEAALSDPLGESISVAQVLDAVVTVRALEADLDRNCVVDVVDAQRVSYRYQTVFGSLQYDPFYDLEPPVAPDGDIDIKDLQFVYGRDSTTCAAITPPTPSPTPTPTPVAAGTPAATPTACLDNDGDTLCDAVDPDDDNDGLLDSYEAQHSCLNPFVKDAFVDQDADGLVSIVESGLGTDPCNADTDRDAMPDGYEAAHSCLDPLAADGSGDADADGLSNLQEITLGTEPCKADTDGDGCVDGRETPMGYNPFRPYDFYDVPVPVGIDPTPNGTRDRVVTLADPLAVLAYVGTFDGDGGKPNSKGVSYDSDKMGAGTKAGLDYDRSVSPPPNPPNDAGPPNGAVTLSDALGALAQVGLDCSGPP